MKNTANSHVRDVLLLKLKEALFSVLPVTIMVLVLTILSLVHLTSIEIKTFMISAIVLIVGIAFFNLGADLAMTPMGEYVGEGLTKSKKLGILLSVCFMMGLLITIAEPDLSVLANQVGDVIHPTTLIATVGIGVGAFLLIAILKMVFKKDLSTMLLFFYLLLFAFSALLIENSKSEFLPLCFDSGGVTTGPITVPFMMALGVGISLTLGGKDAKDNSFGLIAFCSVGPILSVIILSLLAKDNLYYPLPDYTNPLALGSVLLSKMWEVGKSLLLMMLFFFILQSTIVKLPKKKILQILRGSAYTFVGLVMFLTSVSVGFMPIGFKIGEELARGNIEFLVVFSFLLGMVVVLAEPAVHVLNEQVDEITNGAVSKREMRFALSLGVGLSLALSIVRIIFNFSLLYYLIPGYIVSLGLSFFVPKLYTAIAFDSGGVASGPLTSTFILPLAIGICTTLQGQSAVLNLAFGVVAMVAMTPLITIQMLGFKAIMKKKHREQVAIRKIITADDAQIIYFK